jgi:hypothetical protein
MVSGDGLTLIRPRAPSTITAVPSVNGGAKTGHGAAQKSASLGVTGALANALPI